MTFAFIVTAEAELSTIEQDVVDGAKAALNYVDNVLTTDIDPALLAAWNLIKRNGGALLLAAATNVLPSLAAGQWGTAVTNLIADAKAAGAETLSNEEQLAASTALQITQAAQAMATLPSGAPEPTEPTPTTA